VGTQPYKEFANAYLLRTLTHFKRPACGAVKYAKANRDIEKFGENGIDDVALAEYMADSVLSPFTIYTGRVLDIHRNALGNDQ
jgi:hypothetical protein